MAITHRSHQCYATLHWTATCQVSLDNQVMDLARNAKMPPPQKKEGNFTKYVTFGKTVIIEVSFSDRVDLPSIPKVWFCKKLLRYKWTSDQLNPFVLTFFPVLIWKKKCGQKGSTGQRFICMEVTSYKIHILVIHSKNLFNIWHFINTYYVLTKFHSLE